MPSRRDFLKLTSLAALSAALPRNYRTARALPSAARRRADLPPARRDPLDVLPPGEWPPNVPLGRGVLGWGAPILNRPHRDGVMIAPDSYVYPNEVVRIIRSVVGLGVDYYSHVWFELEQGYIWAPYLQPVMWKPQTPVTSVPPEGYWGEVVTPYFNSRVAPDPDAAVVNYLDLDVPVIYSSVFFLAEVKTGADGQPWYRVTTETGLDLWMPATDFRIIQPDEITPISPDVPAPEKKVMIYLEQQALSAFEGEREVFRTNISSGRNYPSEDGTQILNGTPLGPHLIGTKRISRHMIGSDYSDPGIGWVSYFTSDGAALHSTYWHNSYGLRQSHGCINCRPEDAKWLFRWTTPSVPYYPGTAEVAWYETDRITTVDLRESA
jgi:lipoprotein-anchoring transpeptidase ErfK/SrfK